MTLLAPAMASSIASRRSSAIASSFSRPISVFADLTSLDNDLLRLRSCCLDLPLLFSQSASGFFTVTFRAFDCFLERFFAGFHRCGDLREHELPENREQNEEDDERPEHEAGVRRQEIARLRRFFRSHCGLLE